MPVAASFPRDPFMIGIRVSLALALTVPAAAQADWSVEGNQAGANFSGIFSAGDVDGDGFDDVLVGGIDFAHLYLGSASGPATTPDLVLTNDQPGSLFGWFTVSAGDVNADGFDDVLISAPFYDNGQTDEGRAYLYLGSAGGLASTPAWTVESDQADAQMGYFVGSAGDVDGDTFDDVLVSAIVLDNGNTDEGRVHLYLGSASGPSTTPDWTAEGQQDFAWFGTLSLDGLPGDVNGDGFDDVLVGAVFQDGDLADEGIAYLYLGSASGPSTTPDWTTEGDQALGAYGWYVAMAGDVNADGYDDVLTNSVRYDNGEMEEGRAYLYLGSAGGLATSPAWTVEGNQAGAAGLPDGQFPVSAAGDVNGDGYDDVLVGAPGFSFGESSEGRAFLYLGSPPGLSASPSWIDEQDQADAQFAYSLCRAGDVNGDGFDDFAVGAPFFDNGETDEGRAYLYLGSASVGSVLYERKISATAGGFGGTLESVDNFGHTLEGLGDLDGDGIEDLAVGALGDDDGGSSRGAVWILFLDADGTVKSEQKISATSGGLTGTLDDFDNFGVALASLGDLDGDTVGDLAVGAWEDDDGGTGRGAVWILFLNADGTVASEQKISSLAGGFTGALDDGDAFGGALQALGDLDGDGINDLAVGAPEDDDGGTDRGALWILFLDTDGTVQSEQKISASAGGFSGPLTDDDRFGHALAELGDLDGAGGGARTLAVGAFHDQDAGLEAGAVWLVGLSASGTVSSAAKLGESRGGFPGDLGPGDQLGYSLEGFDLGGRTALAVGERWDDDGAPDAGAVWVLLLEASGAVADASKISAEQGGFAGALDGGDLFGSGAAALGDLDGDGRTDLALGASLDDDVTDAGALYVCFLNDGTLALGANATTWTGATDSDWTDASNWGNGVPDATLTAIVPDALTTQNDPVIAVAGQSCDSLWIQAGGTLDVSAGMDSLGVFGGATVSGPITGTGELVFEQAGTLAGAATIGLPDVRADADLSVQGGPLVLTGTLTGNADVFIDPGADLEVQQDAVVQGDLTVDGALTVGDSLTVGGGIVDSSASGGGSGGIFVGGTGECVTAGEICFHGEVVTACTLSIENPSGPALNLDIDSGWPAGISIDVAGTITLLTSDFSIGGDLVLESGTLAIGVDGTLDVNGTNGIVIEAPAVLDVTGFQTLVPAPAPITVRGKLQIGPGGELLLESNLLTVESGGILCLAGAQNSSADLSGSGSFRYGLALLPGATLAAQHFAFRQMQSSGISIPGAVALAPAPLDLRAGLFDLPAPGGRLLELERASPRSFYGLRFEDTAGAAGAVNARVPGTSAALRFLGWSGDFGGEAFEDDGGIGEPGLLEWGPRLEGPALFFPKLGRPAPPSPPLPLVVGPGGRFADVPAALVALTGTHAGERVTLELARGAHAAFELDARALPFDLVLTAQPGAWIDASADPLRILDVPAGRSLELVGLRIDAGKPASLALEVLDCTGVVLLDGSHIAGQARLASSLAVALQDSVVTGELALERGSRALGSGGAQGYVDVQAGCSWSWHERGPHLALDGSQATLTWEKPGLAWLLASPRLGWAVPRCGQVGAWLLDREMMSLLVGPGMLVDGQAEWNLALPGCVEPVYLQALVLSASGSASFSGVSRIGHER